jgi:hypothetical protein
MNTLKSAIAVASLLSSVAAFAATYVEIPDAGETLATAQTVAGGTDKITGNVANSSADLFKFGWGGGAFYVNTVGTAWDSQLFLFDSTGAGVQGNDDGVAFAGPAYLQLASLAAGTYYLGISGYDWDPYSASGIMFQSSPFSPLYGPLNGTEALASWGGGSGGGDYEINFRQFTGQQGDPNPVGSVPDAGATLGFLGLGFAGLAAIRRRK